MAKVHDKIDGRLCEFILAQPMFFVATAPSGSVGHVNLSPKGLLGCFAVLGEHRVAYLDYTGSGAETIAHLRDNGRITVMFCAFAGPPNIVRLHGQGRVVLPGDEEFGPRVAGFGPVERGLRSIIVVDVERVSDSCGFSVPRMEYVDDRALLSQWAEHKSDDELDEYRAKKNSTSIDGLPALT